MGERQRQGSMDTEQTRAKACMQGQDMACKESGRLKHVHNAFLQAERWTKACVQCLSMRFNMRGWSGVPLRPLMHGPWNEEIGARAWELTCQTWRPSCQGP